MKELLNLFMAFFRIGAFTFGGRLRNAADASKGSCREIPLGHRR